MKTEQRIKALAKHLECDVDDISESKHDDTILEIGKQEYYVVDDAEADTIWDERQQSYLEECILPELPDHLQNYFDDDAWYADAKMDGRGHAISSYDGDENEVEIDGETVCIFRLS